ncbi:MAG: Flagellar biosynthesis protein FliS [Brockia lithotrophica]|uniref:Flagellar biosynthesis protein FliS n=1 Tax=Brockia lithotrophica TaxID=933949 RepID=A0A2T5G476_9BACL|nr:flagellar export chaperone FliS [Brockia lithotrophica]PTQ50975.1 MAG: Flagellar biosynthesis protein FliS [Brockia lithotrophica]
MAIEEPGYPREAAQAYEVQRVYSAPPEELVLLLYEAGARHGRRALAALEGRNLEEAHLRIVKMQDVLDSLLTGLREDLSPGRELAALYRFYKDHLVAANVHKDPVRVREAVEFFEEMAATWREAVRRARSAQGTLAERGV